MNKKYLELTKLIRSKQNDHEILKCLSNYHENDIADMLTVMTQKKGNVFIRFWGHRKLRKSSHIWMNHKSTFPNSPSKMPPK